jgi:hypothetical protein
MAISHFISIGYSVKFGAAVKPREPGDRGSLAPRHSVGDPPTPSRVGPGTAESNRSVPAGGAGERSGCTETARRKPRERCGGKFRGPPCGAAFQIDRACQRHRHAPQQPIVDYLRLGEIGRLRRAADIGDGGQQIILHHGPSRALGDISTARSRSEANSESFNRRVERSPSSSRKNSDVFGSTCTCAW